MNSAPLILLIDNYDSFVFNLARYLEELGCRTIVRRNDAIPVREVTALAPAAIVLSPGPGVPGDAGICEELIREYGSRIPTLGVCLGHQAIATALGGKLRRSDRPRHGRASRIEHDGSGLFQGCPNPMTVGRYHSLIVDEESLPEELEVTSRTADSTIMSLSHRSRPVWGVQFHPESVLTPQGRVLLGNFLGMAGVRTVSPDDASPVVAKVHADDFYLREIGSDALRPL